MIQFNLLPDVKLEYVKTQRTKHTVIMTSVLIATASLVVFALLFTVVNVAQKKHLSDLDKDITTSKNTLKAKPDLAKILTIQNQLNSLTDLHNKKPVASRTLGFIGSLTPQNVNISSLKVNYNDKTITIEGSTDSLATVNTFTDTLKFTSFSQGTAAGTWEVGHDYKTDDTVSYGNAYYIATNGNTSSSDTEPGIGGQWKTKWKEAPLAFKDVVLANFTVATTAIKDKNKAATYTITLKYDQTIFSSDKNVTLQVAKQITTRSETEKPSAFQANPKPTTEGSN